MFIGHLVLEKTLKAIYLNKKGIEPPRTHDLLYLIQNLEIEIDDNTKSSLDRINDFHIEARYPDEKLLFYKSCDQQFAIENFTKIKEIYLWLMTKIK